MRITVDIVGIETINKLLELGVIQNLPPDPGGVAGVVGELDRVDGVHLGTEVWLHIRLCSDTPHLEAEQLEGEGGGLVAHVARHHVRLHRQHSRGEVRHVCNGNIISSHGSHSPLVSRSRHHSTVHLPSHDAPPALVTQGG